MNTSSCCFSWLASVNFPSPLQRNEYIVRILRFACKHQTQPRPVTVSVSRANKWVYILLTLFVVVLASYSLSPRMPADERVCSSLVAITPETRVLMGFKKRKNIVENTQGESARSSRAVAESMFLAVVQFSFIVTVLITHSSHLRTHSPALRLQQSSSSFAVPTKMCNVSRNVLYERTSFTA